MDDARTRSAGSAKIEQIRPNAKSVDFTLLWNVVFLTVPVVAGVVGYHYEGWLGALVNPIAAVVLCGLALVGVLITSAWITYLRDRARVSRLSDEQLNVIVAKPSNADFRFAFAQLESRGMNMQTVQHSLIAMLASPDVLERRIGLARLQEIRPALRHSLDELAEENSEHLKERIEAIPGQDGSGRR